MCPRCMLNGVCVFVMVRSQKGGTHREWYDAGKSGEGAAFNGGRNGLPQDKLTQQM